MGIPALLHIHTMLEDDSLSCWVVKVEPISSPQLPNVGHQLQVEILPPPDETPTNTILVYLHPDFRIQIEGEEGYEDISDPGGLVNSAIILGGRPGEYVTIGEERLVFG